MSDSIEFDRLTERDLIAIELQPSQQQVLGQPGGIPEEHYPLYCAQPNAWACRVNGRLIACFGIAESFPGRHGVGWALLAECIGPAHLALTRFVRAMVESCGLARIEAMVRAPDVEAALAARPWLDSGQVVVIARTAMTPEMRWAEMVGLTPVHLMRLYGGAGESVMLCERLTPIPALAAIEREAA